MSEKDETYIHRWLLRRERVPFEKSFPGEVGKFGENTARDHSSMSVTCNQLTAFSKEGGWSLRIRLLTKARPDALLMLVRTWLICLQQILKRCDCYTYRLL
jgi:hypothetical protein